jgi:hypothetical protein
MVFLATRLHFANHEKDVLISEAIVTQIVIQFDNVADLSVVVVTQRARQQNCFLRTDNSEANCQQNINVQIFAHFMRLYKQNCMAKAAKTYNKAQRKRKQKMNES